MTILRLTQTLFLYLLLLFFVACDSKTDDLYPDTGSVDKDNEIVDTTDDDNGTTDREEEDSDSLGGLGDPCKTAQDCQMQYKCVANRCVQDGEIPDKDQKPDLDSGDSTVDDDGDTADSGSDLDSGDTTDEDETDTAPDNDTPFVDEGPDWDGTAICGNGIVEPGENCDDKNAVNDDYCANDCLTVNGACGDSIKQKYEICDDGNADDGDYCSADCKTITGSCGDGTPQTGEICDDGNDNGKYGFCSFVCDGPGMGCGDGVLQGNREQCDDGNVLDGDYCSADCQTVNGMCGDGTLQPTLEVCDDGNRDDGDYCSADCQTTHGFCGDNIKQTWEECEDGNTITDSCTYGETSGCTVCSAICKNEAGNITYCGDDIIDSGNGEICDDGSDNGSYGKCATDCLGSAESCGDGVIQGGQGETCDEGVLNGTYGHCSGSCDGTAYCGDGVRDPAHELCDDGNNVPGDYCSGDCQYILGSCGDNIQQDNEECDDGNTINDDYCTIVCKINGYCGDGVPQSNEMCDDGVYNASYGYCNNSCDGMGPHCGDGIIDIPEEMCEIGNSTLCSSYGPEYMDGSAECNPTCSDYNMVSCDTFKPSSISGTGITHCYNNTTEITCTPPGKENLFYGQDGDFYHAPVATTPDTISGDYVVSDISTAMWQGTLPATYAGCTQGTPAGSKCSATEAATYCGNLSYAGFSDWSLPPIEHFSFFLTNYETAPHIAPDLASLSESTTYWSATTHSTEQWIYNLANTEISLSSTTDTHKVRCVRNLPSQTIYDFISFTTKIDSGDTYYSEAASATDWTPPLTTPTTWQNALSHCIALSYAGFTDWRLPNATEILFLSNKEEYNPASLFPEISSILYWSATTSVEENEKAFAIDMIDGAAKPLNKTETHLFYCIRVY